MNILVIGQCTLHWGRMEFGNIGNYYIIEPFMRELHAVFSNCTMLNQIHTINKLLSLILTGRLLCTNHTAENL